MAATLAVVGPLIGMGSSLFGMANGAPANNVQIPNQQPQLPGMGQAAGSALSNINDLSGMNIPGALIPQYQQVTNSLLNNPFSANAMHGAGAAEGLGYNAAGGAAGAGDYLSMLGRGITPYAAGVMNQGFDPRGDLYNRNLFQTQQQSRAGNELRGIDNTPYGAGVENDNTRNFNMDWNSQQLQRMISSLGAGSGAMGQAGNLMNTGVQLSGQAPGFAQQAGMFPYQTFNQIGGNQMGALNSLSQAGMNATNVPQMGIQDYLAYLGAGNQAQGVNNQTAQLGLNQANMGFQQNQTMGNQFGQSLAALGRGWGSGTPGGGGAGGGGPSSGTGWG